MESGETGYWFSGEAEASSAYPAAQSPNMQQAVHNTWLVRLPVYQRRKMLLTSKQ